MDRQIDKCTEREREGEIERNVRNVLIIDWNDVLMIAVSDISVYEP
jgi:hypothetical protein